MEDISKLSLSEAELEAKRKGVEELTKCIKTLGALDCSKEQDWSAFTISEEALEKLTGEEEDRRGGKRAGKGSYQAVERQDAGWRAVHDCLEESHARKTATDYHSIKALERSLKKTGHRKSPCAGGAPLVECYGENGDSPLECRNLVRDYISCLNNYTQAAIQRMVKEETAE